MPKDEKIFGPLHEKARKLAGQSKYRYLNVSAEPVAGEVWVYFDSTNEGEVRWHIDSVDKASVTITKLDGDQIGYTTYWPIREFTKKRWRPESEEALKYLWACPECRQDRPILIGDYVCIDCREGLDIDA